MGQINHLEPEIGEVVITKRRSSKNIRLSINAAGKVLVGLPSWTPYEAGILFVKKHRSWIQKQLLTNAQKQLSHGNRIGRKHRLIFINKQANNGLSDTRVGSSTIVVKTHLDPMAPAVQKAATAACERALKAQADIILPQRVGYLSRKYSLPYKSLKIRKLTSRWGSCSNKKDVTLSYFLVQLPDTLIDYVIIHELTHTIFHNHSHDFWAFMSKAIPNLGALRIQIKAHKPRVEPH